MKLIEANDSTIWDMLKINHFDGGYEAYDFSYKIWVPSCYLMYFGNMRHVYKNKEDFLNYIKESVENIGDDIIVYYWWSNQSFGVLRKRHDKPSEEPFDVWVVYMNSTNTSWGHATYFFTEENKALEMAKGKGWWGSEAPIRKLKALNLNNKIYLIDREIELTA